MIKLKKIEQAEVFLHKQLSSGPQLARTLIADSKLDERTLQRAARRMQIRRSRLGQVVLGFGGSRDELHGLPPCI